MPTPPELHHAAVWAALLLLATITWCFVRRRREPSDHPHCRRCGFDLFGLPETSHHCPECGGDVANPRGRVHFTRARSPWRWLVLACAIAFGLLAGRSTWHYLRNDYNSWHHPDIVHAIHYANGDRGYRINLLARRVQEAPLGSIASWLIGRNTTIPQGTVGAYSDEFASVMLARAVGYLDDEQWAQFVERCNPISCSAVFLDPEVSRWFHVKTNYDVSDEGALYNYSRHPPFGDRFMTARVVSATLDGVPMGEPTYASSIGRAATARWHPKASHVSDRSELRVRLEIRLDHPTIPSVNHTWEVDLLTPLQVLPSQR